MVVVPFGTAGSQIALVEDGQETSVGGGDGVVHPHCHEAVREEEEEGVDECLVFAYEKAEGEVVVVVSVVGI